MRQLTVTLLLLLSCLDPVMAQDATAPANNITDERPRIGLVLSGGGALGLAHIGVLKTLEEMRVPVDCVVGTSMGALVGGLYATGVGPQTMDAVIQHTDIFALFDDRPPRQDIPQTLKRDDYRPLFDYTLGLSDREVKIPPGLSAGYKFELFLKSLMGSGASVESVDFDQLPTPYRAVATDLSDGTRKVFDHGELSRVMRASMSLPGIVSPTHIEGHTYIDGGLVSNLPVDVGRATCGDILIVVNVSSNALKHARFDSSLDVARQSVVILTEQNMLESLNELQSDDILITPYLDDFTSASFNDKVTIINRGTSAARNRAKALSALALSENDYARYQEQRQQRRLSDLTITRIETRVQTPVTAQAVLRDIPKPRNGEYENETLTKDLTNLYGRGDFAYVGYSLRPEEDGSATAIIKTENKPWNGSYLKVGLGALTDFNSPSQLNLAASYRKGWVNRLGAEWRNDLQLGYTSFLSMEFNQPLQHRDGVFTSAHARIHNSPMEIYAEQRRLGNLEIQRYEAGMDVGLISKLGELRIGPWFRAVESTLNLGTFEEVITNADYQQAGMRYALIYDQLDSAAFPRQGARLNAEVINPQASWRGDDTYFRTQVGLTAVKSHDRNTLAARIEWGGVLAGEQQLPEFDLFQLGGPGRLSGLYLDQLTGSEYNLETLNFYHRYANLPAQIGKGLYWGVSLESGSIEDPLMKNPGDRLYSAALFWGADTKLGAAYIGYGISSLEQYGWYLLIGPRF